MTAKLNNGIDFASGQPGYIDLGVLDCLQYSAFTVEAWIYPRSTAMSMIVSQDTRNNNNQRWQLYTQDNQLVCTMSNDTNSTSFTLKTKSFIPLNAWTHVAILRQGDEYALAVNGNMAMTGGSNVVQTNVTTSVKVGGRLDTNGAVTDAFDGIIDEVKFFDSQISPQTLSGHYRQLADTNFNLQASNGTLKAAFVHPQSVEPVLSDFRTHLKVNSEMRVGLPITGFVWDAASNTATLSFTPLELAAVEQNIIFTVRYRELPVDADFSLEPTTIAAPSLSSLVLNGSLLTREVLRPDYLFTDPGGFAENGSEYLWEVASSTTGPFSTINGLHTRTMMLLPEHNGKYIRVTVTPRNERLCFGESQSVIVGPVVARSGNPRTDWFRNAHYGVSHHFLPNYLNLSSDIPQDEKWQPGESWDDFLSTFDVQAYAKAVSETGAGFVLLTMDQHAGYNLGPNKTHDAILDIEPGVRSAIRDLPLEMAQELAKYDIKLMLYMMGYAPAKASLVYYDDDANQHSPDR